MTLDELPAGLGAAARGAGPGHDPRITTAILGAAFRADAQGLLESILEGVLSAFSLTAGVAWLGGASAVRGLPAPAGAAVMRAAQQAAASRSEPLAVSDWGAPPAAAAGGGPFLRAGVRAALIAGFTSADGQPGGLVIGSGASRAWAREERALVEAACATLREAAVRLRLHTEMEERLRLLERARALGQILHRPAAIGDVAKMVGEGALELSHAARGAVYLCQPDGTLVGAWWCNLSRVYVDQVAHNARLVAHGHIMDGARPDVLELSGRGIDAAGPVFYEDVRALPPAVLIPRLTQMEGYRALANWPLLYEGHVLGLLSCYDDAPRTWTVLEREAMQTFAQDAAFALHNAQLRDAQLQRSADLEVLFDLSRRLRAARNAMEIYQILVGHAMDLLHADSGLLTLIADDRPEFDCVFTAGMPDEIRGASFPVSGSPLGPVAQTGVTYRTVNFGGEPLPVWMSGSRGIGPAAIVPVRSERQTIGVIYLGRKRRPDVAPFTEAEVRLLEGIAEMGGTAIRRARLFEDLEDSHMQMVISLARTVDARDSYTSGHSERISEGAAAVARELGCSEIEIRDIRWGALLHDIGKIGVPDAILRKPGKLTEAEWAIMRKHPVIGAEILGATERMRGVATLVRLHQEKWDGTGYPDGLKGEEIPIGARILAVCDAYSAITDNRPYKRSRSHDEAVAELQRCKDAAFDPGVVDVFIRVIERMRDSEHHEEPPARAR